MIKGKSYSKSIGSVSTYLRSRGSTFAFIMFFIAGLAGGSIFGIGGTDGGDIIRSIVLNELSMQLERGLPQLIMSSVAGFAGIFIFAYLCVNCSKGALLVYMVPLVHGMSVGSFVTITLYNYGISAFSYVLICIFLPKALETLLLLSLCNKTSRYCKEQFGTQPIRHKGRESFPTLLYLVLFGLYFIIESLFIYAFRWLLL